MKILTATALLTVITTALHAGEVEHHYENVIEQVPYKVKVCKQKSELQGGVEGAVIGGLLGEALGNDETAKHLGIFGALVGANEAKKKRVCHMETRYEETPRSIYTHSTITFTDNGKVYTVSFQR